MFENKIILSVGLILTGIAVIEAQTVTSRCFQFTWLGPRFNNDSVFINATCEDATRLSSGVPCRLPLVASFDGTWPDTDYIWTNHFAQASCILATNDVCAKYTYYFDGHAENSTYMCTRAVDTDGAAITSGCFRQVNGSFVQEVCFCRSVPGGMPCNTAYKTQISIVTLFVGFILFLLVGNMNSVNT